MPRAFRLHPTPLKALDGFPAAHPSASGLPRYTSGFSHPHRKRRDTKMSAPSMNERKVCWNARDEYWKCLDENSEDITKCEKYKGTFENACPQQWVKYFNRRREYLKYKALLETEGFKPSEPNKS
ncbi:hypothetical protein JRQ81_009976 [Phrynocephalus forsythii]|uniref:Cytochrome c oxidase assembly factor 6 homolog n=1 Tax=Phrynocephalus forsythii TaxID=171643 RepID=A0A9Q0Y7Z2_9SAUR|nr:hypothetical protein JRQ81_009976 [Phrynocephalus forsythii]